MHYLKVSVRIGQKCNTHHSKNDYQPACHTGNQTGTQLQQRQHTGDSLQNELSQPIAIVKIFQKTHRHNATSFQKQRIVNETRANKKQRGCFKIDNIEATPLGWSEYVKRKSL